MQNGRHEEVSKKLESLIKDGFKLKEYFVEDRTATQIFSLEAEYQKFFTVSSELVRQIAPSRYPEYCLLYRDDKRKIMNVETYSIRDYISCMTISGGLGVPKFNFTSVAFQKLMTQISILVSLKSSLRNILFDLKAIIAADLYDSEIDSCRSLMKAKHYRAAGALAGVILEKHLGSVVKSNSIVLTKKNPAISDFIEALKSNGNIDIVQWRGLQRLADIRNLAAHAKEREPTADEIGELIDGVDKTLKLIL